MSSVLALNLSHYNIFTFFHQQSVRFWLVAGGTSLLPHLQINCAKAKWLLLRFSNKLLQKYSLSGPCITEIIEAFTFSYQEI